MILLVTAAAGATTCAAALAKATGERTQTARSLRDAGDLLRSNEYTVVVIDQATLEPEFEDADALLPSASTAIPLVVNLAISGVERVVRDVRAALHRRQQEQLAAMRAAESLLRSELNGAVTGILLSSQLALAVPALPPEAEAKIKSVYELASDMSLRLKIAV